MGDREVFGGGIVWVEVIVWVVVGLGVLGGDGVVICFTKFRSDVGVLVFCFVLFRVVFYRFLCYILDRS